MQTSTMECTSTTKPNTTEEAPIKTCKTGIKAKKSDAAKTQTLEKILAHDSTSKSKTVQEEEAVTKPNDAKATINPKKAVDHVPNVKQTHHVQKTTQGLTPVEQSSPLVGETQPDITLALGASSYIRQLEVKERVQHDEIISGVQQLQSVEHSNVGAVVQTNAHDSLFTELKVTSLLTPSAAVCQFTQPLPISVNKTEEKTPSTDNEQSAVMPLQTVDLTPSLAQQRNVKQSPQVMLPNKPKGSDVQNVQSQIPAIDLLDCQHEISIDAVPTTSEPQTQIVDSKAPVSQAEVNELIC